VDATADPDEGERLGPVEVLVNNAGVGSGADPAELAEAS
jgi:short-subunit dehydrogenase